MAQLVGWLLLRSATFLAFLPGTPYRRAAATDAAPPCTFGACRPCLPDAVWSLTNLTILGPDEAYHQAPLRIGRGLSLWDASATLAQIVGILVEEVLGIQVQYAQTDDESAAWLGVNNCIGYYDYECDVYEVAGEAALSRKLFGDVLADVMWSAGLTRASVGAESFEGTQLDWAVHTGTTIGPAGFTNQDGIFIFPEMVEAGRKENLDLRWMPSWEDPKAWKYMDHPDRLIKANITAETVGCASDIGFVQTGMDFLTSLGWSCKNSWWLTPACAALGEQWSSECVVFIDDNWGYRKPELYAALASRPVPFAKLVVGYSAWYDIVVSHAFNVSFDWWMPDATLGMLHPVRISLLQELEPRPEITLKAAWAPLLDANDKLTFVLQNVFMRTTDMEALMTKVGDAYGAGMRPGDNLFQKVACDWVRDNEANWITWLPSPTSCSKGQVYDANKQQCMPCMQGTHWMKLRNNTVVCLPCSAGMYAPGEGRTDCLLCTTGTFQEEVGQSICKKCEGGSSSPSLGQTTCAACAAGRATLNQGSSECAACSPGTFSGDGALSCTICPAGNYSDRLGSSACTACEDPLVTTGRGSASKDDCICPQGTYMASGRAGCRACPVRMTCEMGSSEESLQSIAAGRGPLNESDGSPVPFPQVEAEYWTPQSDPLSVFRCLSAYHCPGGGPGSCAPHLVGQGCAGCEPGYDWTGKACTLCGRSETSSFIFPTLPILCLFVVVLGMYHMSGDPYEKWNSWSNAVNALGFITLNHYQVLSLIRKANMNIPYIILDVFGFWAFTEDVVSVFKMGCAGYSGFAAKWAFKSIAPAFVALVVVSTFLGSLLIAKISKRRRLRMEPDRVWNVLFSLIFAFFNAIASLSLALFKCTEGPNGIPTQADDPSFDCYRGQWDNLLIGAIFAVLVYCLGCGLLFCWAIYRATDIHIFSNRGFQMRWKFLFLKFRADVHWWALVILTRGVLINAAFVATKKGLGQLYWIMLGETLYLSLTVTFMPWRHRSCNVLACATSISIMYACALIAVFTERDPITDSSVARMAVVFTFMPLAFSFALMTKVVLTGLGYLKPTLAVDYGKLGEAARAVSGVDKETLKKRFEGTGEWDRFYLVQFCEVVRSELLFLQSGSRTISKLSSSMTVPAVSEGGPYSVETKVISVLV